MILILLIMSLNQFLTQSIEMPSMNSKVINGNTVDNLQSGGLLSDLKITKSGTVIATNSDWNYFSPTSVTYIADNQIQIRDSNVFDLIVVGDRLIVDQSTTKYFYVIDKDLTNSYLYLDAGDNYTFTSASVLSVGFSKLLSPSGFPVFFSYTPELRQGSDNGVFTLNGTVSVKYNMIGNTINQDFEIGGSDFPSSQTFFIASSPFRDRGNGTVFHGSEISPFVSTAIGTNGYIHWFIEDDSGWMDGDFIISISSGDSIVFNSGDQKFYGNQTFSL